MMNSHAQYDGSNVQGGFEVKDLFKIVNEAVADVKVKLDRVKNNKQDISIGDMFELQMLMNHLSQLSEMSAQVTAASNTAIMSMARNLKQ